MSDDADLADRVRDLLRSVPGLDDDAVVETQVFGGLGFWLHDHLAVVASREGELLLRVDAAQEADLRAHPHVEELISRGGPLPGWLRVTADGCADAGVLRAWVERGVARAGELQARQEHASGPPGSAPGSPESAESAPGSVVTR